MGASPLGSSATCRVWLTARLPDTGRASGMRWSVRTGADGRDTGRPAGRGPGGGQVRYRRRARVVVVPCGLFGRAARRAPVPRRGVEPDVSVALSGPGADPAP